MVATLTSSIALVGWSVAETADVVHAAPVGAARVTMVGDSTMMAMALYPNDDELISVGYDTVLDAQSCRRLVIGSCRGRFGSVPVSVLPLMRTKLAGQLGQALVVMAGYDDVRDISSDIDAIVGEANAQGVAQVLWLTYRTNVHYSLPISGASGAAVYQTHNEKLRAATLRWPNLDLLDWGGYSATQPSWFSSDGIHLTPTGSTALAMFIRAALDASSATVARCTPNAAQTGTPDAAAAVQPSTGPLSGFVGTPPTRVLDTRDPSLGGQAGKVGAARTVRVPLDEVVPEGSVAAVLTVTAADPCRAGYVTVFPCGPLPDTSNLNFVALRNTAALVVTMLAADGSACLFASVATDLIVDVLGGFRPGGDLFHPIEPTRWVDTRGAPAVVQTDVGTRAAGQEIAVPVGDTGSIPSSATAVMLNLTSTGSSGDTVLAVYPGACGAWPGTSTLNVSLHRDVAASAIVELDDDGTLCLSTITGNGHVVLDVAGWFGPGGGGLAFRPSTPTRLADTRQAGGLALAPGTTLTVAVDQPSMVSVAVTQSSTAGFTTLKPCGATGTSSIVNVVRAEPIANSTAVAPGVGGSVCATTSAAAHVIVDRTGTFVPG